MLKLSNKDIRIIFLAVIIVVAIIAIFLASDKSTHSVTGEISKPENLTQVIELSNKIKIEYPQVYLINGTQQKIDGVQLTQIANNTSSYGEIIGGKEIPQPVTKDTLAEVTLYEGTTPNGTNIVEVTIMNTGTSTLYLKKLVMMGSAAYGRPIIGSSAIDSDYSAQVWGNIPSPTSTKLRILDPGQSVSEYVKGKWIESVTNQTVNGFGGRALFYYDKNDINYNNGFNWDIMVPNTSLKLTGFSNSTST